MRTLTGSIVRRDHLGGLAHEYHRKAASALPRVPPLRCSTRHKIGIQRLPKRAPASLAHRNTAISLIGVDSLQVILRAISDRSSEDTLQDKWVDPSFEYALSRFQRWIRAGSRLLLTRSPTQ
jgi:hypothetical protein